MGDAHSWDERDFFLNLYGSASVQLIYYDIISYDYCVLVNFIYIQ
jgi:hypothetical protein